MAWGIAMDQDRPTVLVIEDDPCIADMLREILELDGYRVECALSGPAGLARMGAGDVDLVLLDVTLPGADGLQVCRRIRDEQSASRPSVVMLTVLGLPEDRRAGLAAGADEYLTKPFDLDELLDRVRYWTGANRPPQAISIR
jgi:DNA-binding response OmpR family regulator